MGQRPAIWSVETADQRCRAIDAAERERTLIEKWTQVAAEASKLKLLPHLHSQRLFLPQVHYLSASRLLIRIEGAQSPSAPSGTEVGDGSFFRLPVFLKPLCDVQKGAKQSGAIIVDEFDQPGLLNEATEFDEVARALTAISHPLPGIIPRTSGLRSVPLHGQAPELSCCCLKVMEQGCWLRISSPVCHLPERRSAPVRSTSRRLRVVSWIVRERRAVRRRAPR